MSKSTLKNIEKRKILIIDDEEDNIILIKRFLRKYEPEILMASSGKKGLQLIEKEKPDFVLLDIQLPDLNGVEVVKLISKKIRKNIKILALTAYSRNEIDNDDFDLFDDVIFKPINLALLIDKLSIDQE